MHPKLKLFASLFAVLLIAAAAIWIILPSGSRISLKKLKIPYSQTFKVHLPGIKNINDAINQIGQTPTLEFKTQNPNAQTATPNAQGQIQLNAGDQWVSTGLSGKQLTKASVNFQQGGGLSNQVVVELQFNSDGTKLFSQITSANIGKPVAIFLDGQPISEPVVQNAITDGTADITGNFTVDQAKALVNSLNSGALPVPIKLISQETVGATLGKSSVQKSVEAGIIGIVMIILFMLIYYRFPGLLAALALLVYSAVSFAIFKIGISFTAVVLVGLFFFLGLTVNSWFGALALLSYIALIFLNGLSPVTLTLAGIAGFILSIGMAVDANILIFERLKEEIRAGKEIHKAVEDGFNRAFHSRLQRLQPYYHNHPFPVRNAFYKRFCRDFGHWYFNFDVHGYYSYPNLFKDFCWQQYFNPSLALWRKQIKKRPEQCLIL